MRVLIVPLAAALAMAAPGSVSAMPAAKNVSPASPDLRRAMAAAEALADRVDDSATAAIAFEAVASHPDFARLDDRRRAAWLLRAARLAVDSGDLARALPLAQASVDARGDDPDAWFLLAQLAASQDRYEDAARALARFATDWPEFVDNAPAQLLNLVIHRQRIDADTGGLLAALHAAGWAPDGVPADHAWARLALVRSAGGDLAGARAAVAGVGAPNIIAWMRSDRRFDAIIDRDRPELDPARAADAWVTRIEALAAASPRSLALRRELGYALLIAGRPEPALALADAVLAGRHGFDDIGDLHWMLNHRAVALRRLGRTDDALAALTAAAAMEEDGHPNVSQVLNLGSLLVDLERPEDALAAVTRLDGMSGYGALVQATVRMRAQLQSGRPEDAAVWFDRIQAGRDDGPMILFEALLWNGRLDDAAMQLQAMLDQPDRRADALDWCQDYLGSEPLPGRLPFVEARRTLLARADVRAAVEAVGRLEPPGIHAGVGID